MWIMNNANKLFGERVSLYIIRFTEVIGKFFNDLIFILFFLLPQRERNIVA